MKNPIVLKTTERDIQEFYVGILGGKITRHFPVNVDDAIDRFNIPQAMEVYELELKNQVFDLCPYETFEDDSIQFMNLHLDGLQSKVMNAVSHHYWTSWSRKDGKDIYFIKDHNNNLFELEN